MNVTYFVALPFLRGEDGSPVPGEAQECRSGEAAVRKARALSADAAGAVAFSRTRDPSTGEFSDAEVLASFGEVPSAADLLAGD